LIQANDLLKIKYDELLRENGALQNQVRNLQTEIELKERRVKAPNENIKIWEHIIDGLKKALRGLNVYIAILNITMIIYHGRLISIWPLQRSA